MTYATHWWPEAEEDLRSIRSWRDAAWIASEVERYASDGVGDLRRVALGPDLRIYVLLLPGYRVFLTLDRRAHTVHVWRVLKSIRPSS